MEYSTKHGVINAIQWDGTDKCIETIRKEFPGIFIFTMSSLGRHDTVVQTAQGGISFYKNDYIVKGLAGEFYPCSPKQFETMINEK